MPQLSNSPQQQTVFLLEARKSFQLGLWFKTKDRDKRRERVDLTDAVLSFTMAAPAYKGGGVVLTALLELEAPELGYATLSLQGADLELEPGEYPFATTLVTAANYSGVVLKGVVQIQDNVDPVIPLDYDGSNPPQNLTLEFARNNQVTVVVDNLPTTDLQIGTVDIVGTKADAGADISGAYPTQFLNLRLPAPVTVTAPSPIGVDTDGTPYFDLALLYSDDSIPVLVDTDGTPYVEIGA